jgi:hypothetical protein
MMRRRVKCGKIGFYVGESEFSSLTGEDFQFLRDFISELKNTSCFRFLVLVSMYICSLRMLSYVHMYVCSTLLYLYTSNERLLES